MSHTVKIQTKFKTEHMNSFRRAIEHFGWTLKENQKARTYPGDPAQNTTYPMVAVNPNSGYDLGVQFNEKSGELEVLGDMYGGSIAKTLGDQLSLLKKEYAACVIEDKLAYDGYTVTRTNNEDGTIDLVAE